MLNQKQKSNSKSWNSVCVMRNIRFCLFSTRPNNKKVWYIFSSIIESFASSSWVVKRLIHFQFKTFCVRRTFHKFVFSFNRATVGGRWITETAKKSLMEKLPLGHQVMISKKCIFENERFNKMKSNLKNGWSSQFFNFFILDDFCYIFNLKLLDDQPFELLSRWWKQQSTWKLTSRNHSHFW